jgi:hypothetical protein
MTRLLMLVEGQSEEIFVKQTLAPHLADHGVFVQPIVLWTKRLAAGGGHRGGVSNWNQIRRSLLPLTSDTDAWITTLLDFYGLPDDVPGYQEALLPGNPRERVTGLEACLAAEINNQRFIPFLALHEFEAWVFCNAEVLAKHFDRADLAGKRAPSASCGAVDGGAFFSGVPLARKAWLSYEAHALPVMESASALTSAKIDLLPHQVVLTHRIATASPRRYLIADEVGLGKTIETALILRELASRGELNRALMVVPAGLVNNWHRELNEVFNLDFEVFGSEGDITDRKTNAFAKHDRLIASIDTLKRPARIKRLLDAPRWDLVVFDEAHHLTAYRNGGKVRKTENYKLAEALKDHSRDLMLLSATPHQGNHFQFWMLAQLLNPTLFGSPEEMLENRHR